MATLAIFKKFLISSSCPTHTQIREKINITKSQVLTATAETYIPTQSTFLILSFTQAERRNGIRDDELRSVLATNGILFTPKSKQMIKI